MLVHAPVKLTSPVVGNALLPDAVGRGGMIGSTGADRSTAGRLGATAPELERVAVQDSGSRIERSGVGRLAQRGRGESAGW